jgi:nicotinamidase-related amidase
MSKTNVKVRLGRLQIIFLFATFGCCNALPQERFTHCRLDTGLVVIDVQNGFIRASTEGVIPKIKALVQTWVAAGGRPVFTRFINVPDSPYERLISTLKPLAMQVIDKNYYSAFSAGAFRDLVRKNAWHRIAIAGIATDSCVLKTAMDAFELGYTPIVLADSCASHGGVENHEAALRILKRNIGTPQVVDTEAFLKETCTP